MGYRYTSGLGKHYLFWYLVAKLVFFGQRAFRQYELAVANVIIRMTMGCLMKVRLEVSSNGSQRSRLPSSTVLRCSSATAKASLVLLNECSILDVVNNDQGNCS